MAAPTRFPSGISTYKNTHVLSTYPSVPNQYQQGYVEQSMYPYIAGNFTVTNTTATIGAGVYNTAAAALAPGYNGGTVSLAITTASGGKAGLALTGNAATQAPFALIPGNKAWFNCLIAMSKGLAGYYTSGTATATAGDATALLRFGLVDNADPTATISNGVYFEIPGTKNTVTTAGNLVIKNTGLTGATVTTTIKNVFDMARPSGLFGDTSSFGGDPAAALTTAGSANKYTSVVVATPGSGYAVAPLVRTTGASAATPIAQMYAQIGGGTGQLAQPGNMGPVGAGIYAPYIAHIGGTGYTTFTNEVNHWIAYSLYYDGKGALFVGINGRVVATIGVGQNQSPSTSAQALAAGATVDQANGNSYVPSNASMTTSIAPILPGSGTFDLIMPMTPLFAAVGSSLNTAATNIMFVNNMQFGAEYN